MTMKRLLLFLFVLFVVAKDIFASDNYKIGTPFIVNYQRSEYKAGNQTWDILQGMNGMMYFANNDGLLEFDGHYWNVYPLSNKSTLRSIESGPDGIIYAGGYNELGYYKIGKMGGVTYFSLMDSIPIDKRDFDDVWKIYNHPDGVIFQTFSKLFVYRNEKMNVIDAPSVFHFSYMVDGDYYINDMEKGLLRYALGNLFKLNGTDKLIGKEIRGL